MKEYITNAGYELLSRMLSGDCTIEYTKVQMGNGTPTEADLKRMTALSNPVVTLDVESVKIETDNTVDITASFTNAEISEAFYYKEKGIFASDGKKEVLFSYAYTTDPELIPPHSEEYMEKRLKSILKQLQSVDAPINIKVKSGIYVPISDYNRDMEAVEETFKQKVDKEKGKGLSSEDYTTEEKKKLQNVADNANNYSLPVADTRLGGVKTTSQVKTVTDKMIPVAIINGIPYYENTTYNLDDMINGLSEGTDTPQDADYYISQYAGGGTEHKEYYRRPMSALWSYIKSKAEKIFQEKGNYAAYNHTHLYAGADTAGGKANSAKVADSVNWNNVEGRPTALPASDVYDWAKSPTRPAYNKSDVGLGNVDNTADANKSVNYATSAGKSNGIIDYGNSANTIQVGFGGSGATTDNLAYIAGYLTGGKQIKDVSKDVLKAWLGSMPANGGNADTLGGNEASYFATAQQVKDINSNLTWNVLTNNGTAGSYKIPNGTNELCVAYSWASDIQMSLRVIPLKIFEITGDRGVIVTDDGGTRSCILKYNNGILKCEAIAWNLMAILYK